MLNFRAIAIYLVKRTMRNQEKHGLNDYELVSEQPFY